MPDQMVIESVASLRAALSAVQTAFNDLPLDQQDSEMYDSAGSRLQYMMHTIKCMVRDAWIDQMVFPNVEALADWPEETANEAGARFSAATKSAILDVVSGLKSLIGVEATDDDKAELAAAIDEVTDGLEALCKRAKKPMMEEKAMESLGVKIAPEVWGTVFIQEGTQPDQNRYRMLVIKEGLSGNRNLWKGDVLENATKLLEGRPIYVDHAVGSDKGTPGPRSLSDRVGWWSEPAYVKDLVVGEQKINGIVATANILENSAHPWVAGMIREALLKGQPNVVGVSVDAAINGKVKPGADGKIFRDIESIVAFQSADLVAEPGAGGQPLAVLEGLLRDEEIMELEGLTLDQVREARPDLYDGIVAAAREGYVQEGATPPPANDTPPAEDPRLSQVLENMTALQTAMALQAQGVALEGMLTASGLPEDVRVIIREEVGQVQRTAEQMQSIIDKYVRVGRTLIQESTSLSSSTLIPFRGSGVVEGATPLDQVQWALDDWFGNPDPERKGKYRPIESMRQFYQAVTGDYDFAGVYNTKESVIGNWLGMRVTEALPGQTHIVGGSTITLPSLFGVSMNRALTKKYRGQNLWWEPIVEKRRLNNFKEQERTRLASFGSLTNRSVGTEEYTELDWAETKEVYTPTGYGNLVPVNRRAFINDDMEGIRRIPTLLGESAGYTINEVVSALFTANSGAGVTLTDGFSVFHANHQGNLGSAALDQASLEAAIVLVSGMVNDASKAIGWRLRHLLVPNALMPTAFRLTQSQQQPGTANNDPNFIASRWGVDNVIYVPQFNGDANNWYAMADPSEITLIEVGFILGREDPEFFVQNGPTEGIVFTNDVINYKVRHEYGADFIDYRGAYGAVVA